MSEDNYDEKPDAYERGVAAGLVGIEQNPFEYGSVEYLDWDNGRKYAIEWSESQSQG